MNKYFLDNEETNEQKIRNYFIQDIVDTALHNYYEKNNFIDKELVVDLSNIRDATEQDILTLVKQMQEVGYNVQVFKELTIQNVEQKVNDNYCECGRSCE